MAIEGGRLLRSAPLGAFTEQTGTLAVEVDEGSAALAERLGAAGLSVEVDGRAVLVAVSDDRPYDLVRDAVADLGLRAGPDGAAPPPPRGPVPRRAVDGPAAPPAGHDEMAARGAAGAPDEPDVAGVRP